MLPFEFTIEGPPLSYQTQDRQRLKTWQMKVRTAAAHRWLQNPPVAGSVRVLVTYYHDGPSVAIDNDNLIKPIQDALNRLVYLDDRQITDTSIRKTDINGAFVVRGMSLILLEAFAAGREFLHVRVESAPDHSQLLR